MHGLKFHIRAIFIRHNIIRLWLVAGILSIALYCPAQDAKNHSAAWYYTKGEAAQQKREWKEAETAFSECLHLATDYSDAYYARAIVREQLQHHEQALTDYNIYLELKPDHFEALFNRAALRYRLKKYDQAKIDFEKLILLPQGETTTIFFRQDAFASTVNKVFTTQGSDKAYLFNYLGLIETQLKNYDKAICWYDSAIRNQPKEADYYVNRGLAREQAGDKENASRDYQQALKLDPTHDVASHNIGSSAARSGKVSEGLQLLTDAINNSPTLPYPYAERGFARMEQKEWKGALEDYNAAIQIDSTNEEYFLNRALIKEKLKNTAGAFRDYSKAIALKENYEKAWLNRGNLLSRLNRLSEAIDDYTVAIFYYAEYATAFYNRGIAYHRLNKHNEACKDIMKAQELGQPIASSMKRSICQ